MHGSVLVRAVRIHTGAKIEDSVVFDTCNIGGYAKVRRAILEKNVKIGEGVEIGYKLDEDRKKYNVTERGIVMVEGYQSKLDISTLQV